jgi:hypothetical protein
MDVLLKDIQKQCNNLDNFNKDILNNIDKTNKELIDFLLNVFNQKPDIGRGIFNPFNE